MAIDRRSFIGVGGAFLASGGLNAGAAEAARTPSGTVRVSQDVPVLGEYDVCVVGAGPGGVGAAVAAARAGKRTILVEHYGYPGGVGTNCSTPTFFRFSLGDRQFIRGLADEFIRRLGARNAAWFTKEDGRFLPDYDRPVKDLPLLGKVSSTVEDMRVCYHDFVSEAGVEKLFYAHFCGAVASGGHVDAVVVDCLEGLRAIKAKVFVDATGAAHLVHRAGGRTVLAPPDKTMHKSVWATVVGQDTSPETMRENRRTYAELYRKHRERLPANVWPDLTGLGVSVGFVNGNSCDSRDMTRMDSEMRHRNFEVLECFRRELKGYGNARISTAIHQVGSRSGRHIVGRACLDAAVVKAARPPADSIMPIYRYWGAHAASMDKGFRGAASGALKGLGGVPYGALVPADLSNVLACGLGIAVEEDFVETIRMMPSCIATGQVAGTAAALALDRSLADVGTVPYAELRTRLEKQGHIVV